MRVFMFGGVFTVLFAASLLGPGLVAPYDHGTSTAQVLLVHHATANQGVDAGDVQFDDCATQRNLSLEGRLEAQQMGSSLREHGFLVVKVLASPFCRTIDTAKLMKMGSVEVAMPFENIPDNVRDATADERVSDARRIIDSWHGPGSLLIVTHSSTIKALTGSEPEHGKFIVVTNRPQNVSVAGLPGAGNTKRMQSRLF